MNQGIVKWFDDHKGYGFIVYQDDQEIFVHFTGILDSGFKSLKADELVSFDIVEGARGPQATNVKKLSHD